MMTSLETKYEITPISDNPTQMTVDAEHIGIRTAMPLLAIAGIIGGFILGGIIAPLLDEALSSLCMSLIGATAGLVILTQIGERVIKPLWGSGRNVTVDTSQLALIDRRRKPQKEKVIQWNDELGVQAWFFEVPTRKSRVSKGWYCTSVRLMQKQEDMIFYTFISPENAQSIPHFSDWFIHLRKKKERQELANADPRQAAEQERYRKLEDMRWNDGAELKVEDFLAVMNLVGKHGEHHH